jgi:hypothetical protein
MRPLNEFLNEQTVLDVKKNMESAPNMGAQFGQDVEPSGTYVSHDNRKSKSPIDNYKLGKVIFKKPLVIEITDDTLISYKQELSNEYKAKKGALTKKLMKKGFDGIITKWSNGDYNEIVVFPNAQLMLV